MTLEIDPPRLAGTHAMLGGLAGPQSESGPHGIGALLKAIMDRLGAAVALVLLAPVMALVSLAILAQRDGPVFFGHERVGRDGRRFRCYKFRTMISDGGRRFDEVLRIDPIARSDWQTQRKIYRDPRVSRLGAFLRATSLDELPQFWNVLRGEMSLVGPRPITAEELVRYGRHAAEYLSVLPGVTGLWQVSGRSDTSYAERVALDVEYVRHQSLAGDLKIMLQTVQVVLLRQGAI